MGIKNIIQEELKSILNEGYVFNDEQKQFSFMQNVKSASFQNYESFNSEFDTDFLDNDLYVNWSVSFWLNDNGIENLIINIDKVSGEFVLELRDKRTDELQQNATKNIEEFQWKYIVDEATLSKGGGLYIRDMDFDFKTNICTVNF